MFPCRVPLSSNFQFSLWDSLPSSISRYGGISDFQFSLWDSPPELCYAYSPIIFQFSLWDSGLRSEDEKVQGVSFNSLCEIQNCIRVGSEPLCEETFNSLCEIQATEFIRQAGKFLPFNSLCEIPWETPRRWRELGPRLSILFVRFGEWKWKTPRMRGKLLSILFVRFRRRNTCISCTSCGIPFNSLCEIQLCLAATKRQTKKSFNSLCEILTSASSSVLY